MNRVIVFVLVATVLSACSAPKPPEPKGDWMPVNRAPAQQGNWQ